MVAVGCVGSQVGKVLLLMAQGNDGVLVVLGRQALV